MSYIPLLNKKKVTVRK